MSVSVRDTLSMWGTCHYLANRDSSNSTICVMSEPDDSLDLYIDFLEKLNPYDWINDFYLLELIYSLFEGDEEP